MKLSRIAIHHSGSRDGSALDWASIRRYHTDPKPQGNGWSDIGYHAGVERVGGVYVVLMGRPWYRTGSHARGANTGTLGLCLIGNFENDAPPLGQLEAAAEWSAAMCAVTGIRTANIQPHRDLGTTATVCPGETDMDHLRWLVARLRGGRVHRALNLRAEWEMTNQRRMTE